MRDAKRYLLLLFPCLFVFLSYSNGLADNHVSILDQNIKAVAAVSSGRYIKVAWTVKLRNETSNPLACDVTISFVDANEKSLEKATKTTTLEANETKTVSDTVLLRSAVANKIVSCLVSITDK